MAYINFCLIFCGGLLASFFDIPNINLNISKFLNSIHLFRLLKFINFCNLILISARDFERAKEYCQAALSLNTENPFAIMLLALIFTARKDYKGALELVYVYFL